MLGLFVDHFAMLPVIHKGNKIVIFNAFFLEILPAEAGQAVLMMNSKIYLRTISRV